MTAIPSLMAPSQDQAAAPPRVSRDATRASTRDAYEAPHPFFLPLLLLSLAIVSWFAFQSYQLLREREQLASVTVAQQTQVDAAAKVRAAVDALAASTQRLANEGNPNARVVIEELRKRGITVNPNPVPTPAPVGAH